MKTQEELNALKAEVKALKKKLAEPSEEQFEQVNGGITEPYKCEVCPNCGSDYIDEVPCPTATAGFYLHCMFCNHDWEPTHWRRSI